MKRLTKAVIDAAIAKSAAMCAGTYEAPPPKKVRSVSKFIGKLPRTTPERLVAIRQKSGGPL